MIKLKRKDQASDFADPNGLALHGFDLDLKYINTLIIFFCRPRGTYFTLRTR